MNTPKSDGQLPIGDTLTAEEIAQFNDKPVSPVTELKAATAAVDKTIKALITVNERGYLEATDFDGRWRMATAFFKSGMVPKSFKGPEQVFVAIEFACQLGLAPLVGIRNIAVINGMPSLWGELPLGLCQKTGQLTEIEEFFFDKTFEKICFENKNLDKQPHGALCRITRNALTTERWFTMDDAKKAGLLDKAGTPWQTYTRRMLQMRARSNCLKDTFADVLSGVGIAEYDYNYLPNAREVEETSISTNFKGETQVDAAAEINKVLDGH